MQDAIECVCHEDCEYCGGLLTCTTVVTVTSLTPTMRDQPEVVGRVRALIEAQRAEAIRDALLRLKTRPDSTDLLASIRCPVLLIVGEEDALTPVEESQRMKEAIQGATLAVIQGAGHLSNLEQPEAFNAAVARFLSDHFGSR